MPVAAVSPPATPPHPVENSLCWFDDGNVVLQAEDTLFRVYKGFLRKQSSVFDDMFSLPAAARENEMETFDSCPLVVVQETAKEMELFILALTDLTFLVEGCDAYDLAVLLQLAHKYQAAPLRQRVMAILRHEFPDTLQAYQHAKTSHSMLAAADKCCLTTLNPRWATFAEWPARVAIMNAARRTRAHILLPSLLLMGCLQPMQIVMDEETSALDAANRKAIVVGQNMVSMLARTHSFRAAWPSTESVLVSCTSSHHCPMVWSQLVATIEVQDNVFYPFFIVDFNTKSTVVSTTCGPCLRTMKQGYSSGIEEAWRKLPSIFGFMDWELLREEEMPTGDLEVPSVQWGELTENGTDHH